MTETDQAPAAAPSGDRARLLDELALRQPAHVLSVIAPVDMPEWQSWLAEMGFLPGEAVMILARGRPGGDPLVVRVGDSTFALRRAEAACVEVAAVSIEAGRDA